MDYGPPAQYCARKHCRSADQPPASTGRARDMIPDNDAPAEGGTGWELQRAAKNLAAAVGNEAARDAVLDVAAALANQSMTTVIPTLQTVLQGVMKQGFGSLEARLDRSDRASLDHRTDLRLHLDSRFDNYGTELDRLTEHTKGLQAGIATLQAEFQTVGETVDGLASQLDGIVASIVEVRAQAAERTAQIYARLDAHNDKLSNQEQAFNALREAVHRLETQFADLYNQTLADKYPREKRLEIAENSETIPELWDVTRRNTAAIEQLQISVARMGQMVEDLHRMVKAGGATP